MIELAFTGEVGASDPSFSSVKLLLHFDGADGATTSIDNSPSGHALTFNSGAQLDTAQAKFGTSSALFALTDDTITVPDSPDWHFGLDENFTIEMFVRFNNVASSSGNQVLISQYNNAGDQRSWYLRLTTSNKLTFFASATGLGTLFTVEGAWTPSNGVWYYIGVERSGSDIRIWVDTTVIASLNSPVTNDAFHNSTQALMIGAFNSSGVVQEFDGWIDELRITKGVARYNGTYVVPTAPFPDS